MKVSTSKSNSDQGAGETVTCRWHVAWMFITIWIGTLEIEMSEHLQAHTPHTCGCGEETCSAHECYIYTVKEKKGDRD